MEVHLLPRLDRLAVDRIVDFVEKSRDAAKLKQELDSMPDAIRYGASGGSRTPIESLRQIADGVGQILTKISERRLTELEVKAAFDADVAAYLSTSHLLQSGEAQRDDVWAFLTSCTLLKFTLWRFGATRERFHGGVRNAFQRLWLRGRLLDRGDGAKDRWELLHSLSEDALVQITERPSIAANRKLALAIAEAWVRASVKLGRGRMEFVMRQAIIGIRLRNTIWDLCFLHDGALANLLDEEFLRASKIEQSA